MKKTIIALTLLFSCLYSFAQTSSITEIQVTPRGDGSGILDVYYSLSGSGSGYNILIEVSFDGGSTYLAVPGNFLSGNLSNVSSGSNRHIVWDGLGSFPNQYSSQTRIRVTANAGSGDGPRDTETQVVDVTNPKTGKTWMDRNLGAIQAATSSTDAQAYGDLYQWGRAADGHQKRTSGTTAALSGSDTPGHGDFILPPSEPYDWRSTQNDNLWQGVNGVNNPCPTGYRLPTDAELDAERLTWSSNNSAGAFASPLKLPVAGGRIYSDGSLGQVGSRSGYWSSTVDGTYSRYLIFGSNFADMYGYYRACGFSVRCFKDVSAISTKHNLNLDVNPTDAGEVSGAGAYEAGESVSIMATTNAGWAFVDWTGDTEYLADANAANTIVTMPAHNIVLTANFDEGDAGWPRDTDTEVVDVTNPETGKTWMDRNLGASRAAISSTDAEAYGDLYQWGRAADGHQKRTSGTTTTLSGSDTPGHENFILVPNYPYDWRSPQNTNLWQGVNGVNNPCPSGYRLPTDAELDAERASWSSSNSAGAFASPLKLPEARSRRSSYLPILFIPVGPYGSYWSSTVDGTYSRNLYFGSSNADGNSSVRADGHSVRCFKD